MNELKPEDVMRAWEDEVALGKKVGLERDFINHVSISLVNATLALLREYKVKIEVLEEAKNQLEIDICNANMNLDHLQEVNARMTRDFLDYQADVKMEIADARAEAITEFAERLKSEMDFVARWQMHGDKNEYFIIGKPFIDEISKELKGEKE